MHDLTDKRVLITGASRGLGQVVAHSFAQAGARLCLSGRDGDALQGVRDSLANSDRHLIHCADLAELGAIAELAAHAIQTFAGIDIVFHAMGGGYGFHDPLLDWEKFTLLYHVNLGAAAELNRHMVPQMRERGWGRIIHVGSVASGEAVGSVGYNTVKAALAGYVRSLGRTLSGAGVVVSAILPGAFYGPTNAFRRLEARTPEAITDYLENRLPRGRIGDADEILALVHLLAGEGASMMAGSCVPIDAGEGIAFNTE